MNKTWIIHLLGFLMVAPMCQAQKLLITYSYNWTPTANISDVFKKTAKKTTTFFTLRIAGNHSEYEYLRTEGVSEPLFKTKVITFKDYSTKEIKVVNILDDPWIGTKKSLINENLSNFTTDTVIFEGKKSLKLTFSNEKKPNFGYAICDLDLPYPDGPGTIYGFPGLVIYYESFKEVYKVVSIKIDNSIKVRTKPPENTKFLSTDDWKDYIMSKSQR